MMLAGGGRLQTGTLRILQMNLTTRIPGHRLFAVVARRDAALFDLICSHRTAWLNRLMVLATRSADAASYLAIAMVGFAVGSTGGAALLAVAFTAGAASASGYLVKRVIARPRPTKASPLRVALLELPDAWSFPSSHTAAAIAAALVIGAVGGPVGLAARSSGPSPSGSRASTSALTTRSTF